MLEVRPFAPADWPLLKALRLASLADAPGAFSTTLAQAQSWTDAEWRARAQRFGELPPASAFAAFSDGQPCGLISCYQSEGDAQAAELSAFWVAPAHRGRGVGEALVAAVWEGAASQDVRELQAWVMADGNRAVGFYKKIGFQETGERRPLVPGSSRAIVLLARQITGGVETL